MSIISLVAAVFSFQLAFFSQQLITQH